MKSYMQGMGLAAPDPKPSPSVNMANLKRLSVLLAETDTDRSRETSKLLEELGVGHVTCVDSPTLLFRALKTHGFDVLMCAERLADDVARVLQAAREFAPATRMVLMRTNDRAGELVPEGVEAIELPFSRLALQGLLHQTASPRGGLWCEVPALSLADILQMYHQAQRSIGLLLSGPIAGRIHMHAGEIVDAESGGERGMTALSRLLEAESGLLRTEVPRAEAEHTISAPFQSVILEAAHRLDERRRDSKVASSRPAIPPPSNPRAREAFGGFDRVDPETTRVSSGAPGPAPAPTAGAVEPNAEPLFLANQRPRRSPVLAAGGLASLAFVAAAVFYLKAGPNFSGVGPTGDPAPGARPSADRETPQTSARPLRPERPPSGPVSEAKPPLPAPGSVKPPPIEREPAAASDAPPPTAVANQPPAAASFELHITSKPNHATVTEGERVLGKTPLTLTIGASSVASAPREFVLRLPGYFPARISRGPSSSDVDAAVALSPRPAVADSADAGAPEDDPETGDPRSQPKDLGIRLRR